MVRACTRGVAQVQRKALEADVSRMFAPSDPTSIAGWKRVGDAPRDTKLELTFAVKQQNTASLLLVISFQSL